MEQLSDAALVEQARAGDQQAFAELYARWFDPVYDFVARITRDGDEAASVVEDAFFKAMCSLAGLHEGVIFKSWIFTIARHSLLGSLERAPRTRPLTFVGNGQAVACDAVDRGRLTSPGEADEATALATLVWEAASNFEPKRLSLLDLDLRQGFDCGGIADVAGITRSNGQILVTRLEKAAETEMRAFVLVSDGTNHCARLDSALASAGRAGLTPDTPKLVERHLAECRDCRERNRKLLPPLTVFGAFAAVASPPGVKGSILDGLLRQWPGAAVSGTPPSRMAPPEPPMPPQEPWLVGHLLTVGTGLAAAAALLGALLFLPASPVALTRSSGQGSFQAVTDSTPAVPGDTSPTIGPTRVGGASPSPTPQNTPPVSPSPSQQVVVGPASPTATNTATPSPGATATSTPPATPTPPTGTPTGTPVPCSPQLGTNLSAPLPVAIDGDSFFVLLNHSFCGSVNFSVSTPPGSWLTVLPTEGTLAAGREMTMSVHVNGAAVPSKEGVYTAVIRISGSASPVDVTVTTSRGGQPPAIVSASGACGSPSPAFSATVTDDVAVASVSLRYTESGGANRIWAMTAGGGGTWTVSVSYASAFNATGFTIVALDGASHADNYPFSPSNCA